ncbi:hypothetical protein N9L75_07375 [Porticoccaceae bacterium]|nr:hypothetical protein [Porticoccaceae bacterium]MDA8652373.1 hypothetical protein [Porticoccaceae bacterium]
MSHQLLLIILIAAGLAQIPNFIASKYMSETPNFSELIKVTMMISPVAIAACVAFIIYFQIGSNIKSYASLSVLSVGVSVFLSVVIQFVFWPGARVSSTEIIGSLIILFGVFLVLLKDHLPSISH